MHSRLRENFRAALNDGDHMQMPPSNTLFAPRSNTPALT
jgi:hypothetical protein